MGRSGSSNGAEEFDVASLKITRKTVTMTIELLILAYYNNYLITLNLIRACL